MKCPAKRKKRNCLWVDALEDGLELDCLDLVIGSPIILNERPPHLERDLGFFSTYNIIAGPLNAKYISGTKWEIPEYPNVVKTYNAVVKLGWEETQFYF